MSPFDDDRRLFSDIRLATRLNLIEVFHRVTSRCAAAQKKIPSTTSCSASYDDIIRCASLGSALLRKVRWVHQQTPLSLTPDEISSTIFCAVRGLCKSEEEIRLLRLLDAEILITAAQYRDRVLNALQRLVSVNPKDWDSDSIARWASQLPSPVDFSSPATYVSNVERPEEGTLVIDVSPTSTVAAKDPIGLTRIQTPVRGVHCNHLQCFDLHNFIAMLRRTAKYGGDVDQRHAAVGDDAFVAVAPCPVCAASLRICDIYVDRIQQTALDVPLTNSNSDQLIIHRSTGVVRMDECEGSRDAQGVAPNVTASPLDASRKRPRDTTFVVEGMSISFGD